MEKFTRNPDVIKRHIEWLKSCLDKRIEWLENTLNRHKGTYTAVAEDARTMELMIAELEHELADIEKPEILN